MFSGLNIGLFGLSRLRLEVMAGTRDADAIKVLGIRKDSNFLLATLLWGNVGVNVFLTLLTNSVLVGVWSFLFSTICITCFGEIVPQAYFTRHALRAGAVLVPIIKFYKLILYPIAKPTGCILDLWLGKEGTNFFKEKEFRVMLKHHADSIESDMGPVESMGASNFLDLDDIYIKDEGEILLDDSIISLEEVNGVIQFPDFKEKARDVFLKQVNLSQKKWVVITNPDNVPKLVLNADQFLRHAVYENETSNPYHFCHRPIVVTEECAKLGSIMKRFRVHSEHIEDDVIDHDLVLYWHNQKKIITGADILGRLMRGIAKRISVTAPNHKP
ncbi:MAG: metal transporter CNNM [Candidatus Omnitrophota bacterium]|jgi:metal transporter CNNM